MSTTDPWEEDWTEEMCDLAQSVASGALIEAGYEPAVYFEINGMAYCHLPLSAEEDRAQDRAMELGVEAVRRTFMKAAP